MGGGKILFLRNVNEDVKKVRGPIPYWAIAEKLNISESTLYRWLRFELSQAKKEQILKAIRDIQQEMIEAQ
jgi:IS30 family transposase